MGERAKSYHWSVDGEIITVDQMTHGQLVTALCDTADLIENIDVAVMFSSRSINPIETIGDLIRSWRNDRYSTGLYWPTNNAKSGDGG